MVKPEELKTYKNASMDILKEVKDRINQVCSGYDEHNNLEDGFGFELNGVSYDVIEDGSSEWTDEGKYQFQDITYQLVSFDKSVLSYPCDKSITDKFDLFINLPVTRSGSYFTDYNYSYDKPVVYIAEIEHVPEKVIPAHDEVRMAKK